MGRLQQLLAALHRAGAGHHHQLRPANRNAVDLDDRVLRVKVAAGKLEWAQDRHGALDPVHALNLLAVQRPAVADDADDGALLSLRDVRLASHLLDAHGHVGDLVLGCPWFHDDDHFAASDSDPIAGVVAAGYEPSSLTNEQRRSSPMMAASQSGSWQCPSKSR